MNSIYNMNQKFALFEIIATSLKVNKLKGLLSLDSEAHWIFDDNFGAALHLYLSSIIYGLCIVVNIWKGKTFQLWCINFIVFDHAIFGITVE